MRKKDVLFICYGNVGRSQMAEAFYNHLTKGSNSISAGILDVATKFGGHPTSDIVEVMREKGLDVQNQTIKQVSQELVSQALNVVILCSPELWLDSRQISALNISGINLMFHFVDDPYETDLINVRRIRDEVERVATDVATKLKPWTNAVVETD